mmetsp:Transcript_22092/g.57039  ORF Transcript_22092/g.57039 Transcript_22092/m.57039 type:complete len:205 (+) Transcript_22092:1274-1888(+)
MPHRTSNSPVRSSKKMLFSTSKKVSFVAREVIPKNAHWRSELWIMRLPTAKPPETIAKMTIKNWKAFLYSFLIKHKRPSARGMKTIKPLMITDELMFAVRTNSSPRSSSGSIARPTVTISWATKSARYPRIAGFLNVFVQRSLNPSSVFLSSKERVILFVENALKSSIFEDAMPTVALPPPETIMLAAGASCLVTWEPPNTDPR